MTTLAELIRHDDFASRHLGSSPDEIARLCAAIGVADIDELISQAMPQAIRLPRPLELDSPLGEQQALARLRGIASKDAPRKPMIGLGYHGTHTPAVILRNVLENPGWYTAYTPYQTEIAQGRLEALLTFQQLVVDLTGLDVANASLLDEATAAAEAMTMARRISKSASNMFFVDADCLPQTLDVLRTRAQGFGFEILTGKTEDATRREVFGALLQYPGMDGEVKDLSLIIAELRASGAIVAVAADPMALVLLKSPGALGADIALGSMQRFGVPMGFGGPHAAYFAARFAHVRSMPGRIIGVSRDSRGKRAYRMSLQTREQHIRREKANSNICTSQALLANMAAFYAVWHGPSGLRAIAGRIHRLAAILTLALRASGRQVREQAFFDTVAVTLPTASLAKNAFTAAAEMGYDLRWLDEVTLGITLDETTTRADLIALIRAFGTFIDEAKLDALDRRAETLEFIPAALLRNDDILAHPVFNTHHTEHAMLRYLKRLQNRDLALDHSMIPLGSCTMKLNATAAMMPITWPEFATLHPFAPSAETAGIMEMIRGLAAWLCKITGFPAVCMQPNSGAQGEYAGLAVIARYHANRGQAYRRICLIPQSAHGTNPASAQMAGMKVITVDCNSDGDVDLGDLKAKAAMHTHELAALMITYPSTHGVFEQGIREICQIVHDHGGQVYLDGANLNALVGLSSPGFVGADVTHMNLHKTFAIPHGGGGPGMGPIALAAHLVPFAPDHVFMPEDASSRQRPNRGQGAVSAAPFGSAGILPISWMYIAMMGGEGLRRATELAILNANYIAHRLKPHYPVLYTGKHGRVAHECLLDIRPIKAATGVSEIDIAKRLMDYGFHAPTVSFPVAGTMMVEPTESETLAELDRFIEAMLSIRDEIRRVELGEWSATDNPLKNAPHTQADLVDDWKRAYSREQAVFPLPWIAENKFWPSVNRIDEVWGDRNLCCVLEEADPR
ncbi:MAG: aminomethyl-transferring glycine dehydrogenase [Betaproteobacteria bacterium]|nr:aminomethyl-transferring glycine dehydrogenase [Betaproteobacteria bacterium]